LYRSKILCFIRSEWDELNEGSWWVEISHGEDIKKRETIDCLAYLKGRHKNSTKTKTLFM